MTCREICDHSPNGKVISLMTDPMHLLTSLSDGSSELTEMCNQVLHGGAVQEPSITKAFLSLNATIREIRSVTQSLKGKEHFMSTVAEEVKKALEKICGLTPLILQTQTHDERVTCLVVVGENLNSFYRELGLEIGQASVSR